jgi:hypothetical protein
MNTPAASMLSTLEQSVWDLRWGHGGAKWKPTAPPSFGSQVHRVDNIGYKRKLLYYGCLYFVPMLDPVFFLW